ncbi:hypothetical protein BHE74_00056864, partial [Ensete ventricosum]
AATRPPPPAPEKTAVDGDSVLQPVPRDRHVNPVTVRVTGSDASGTVARGSKCSIGDANRPMGASSPDRSGSIEPHAMAATHSEIPIVVPPRPF